MSSDSSTSVLPNHVRLVLLPGDNFYLDIPTELINGLCLNPRKYLIFLGWCILGKEGTLTLERDGDELDLEDEDEEGIDNEETYCYVADHIGMFLTMPSLLSRNNYTCCPSCDDLRTNAIDPEIIRLRTNVSSETTVTRDDFRTKLLEQDSCCVWTGLLPDAGEGLHIIPYKRGSEWLRLIIENRPHYGENTNTLNDINDIRNAVFASGSIHRLFDPRKVVVLKTPNHVLKCNDIPPRADRQLPQGTTYPTARYTLQWLVPPHQLSLSAIPHNGDAAFRTNTRKPKPSDLLLHYNYGAAAVKNWGHGVEALQNHAKDRQPPKPAPTLPGPAQGSHDRTVAILMREAAQAFSKARAGTGARTRAEAAAGTGAVRRGEVVELEVQAKWDEVKMT